MKIQQISIAMCTYKGESFLQEQLDSIAQQSRLPDELIISDDNSPDRTIDIISAFIASAPFPVKLYRNSTTIGSTKNFEQAISLCEGDIIVLSDQDDVWHANKLEIIEQSFLDFHTTVAVFSNGNVVNQTLNPLGYTLWETFDFKKKHKNKFRAGKGFEVLLNHNVATGATMAFRSMLKERILPIPPIWIHDKWIAIIVSMTSSINFIDKCLIDYRQHEKQQIGGINNSGIDKIRLSRMVDNYQAQIQEYALLLAYITHNNLPDKDYFISKISDKITHLKTRESIYKSSGFGKVHKVMTELLKGRYHAYSNSFLSAYKDLIVSYHSK